MITVFDRYTILVLVLVFFCGCTRSSQAAPEVVSTAPIAWGTYGGTFGNADGEFHNPGGITFDSDGRIYVADRYNGRVQVLDENGTYLNQWGVDGHFRSLAFDGDDHVYVPIWEGSVIKYDLMGNEVMRWGERGSAPGEFQSPTHIAIDQNEHRVYVADANNNNVQVFSFTGLFLERWENMTANGIAVDSDGNVYVSGTQRNGIQKLSKTGEPLEIWSHTTADCGGFRQPSGIAIGSDGEVFVSDVKSNAIHKLDSNGVPLTCWGVLGSGEGEFCYPSHLAMSSDNSLYVSDHSENHRIQRFTSAGVFVQEFGKSPPSCESLIWPSSVTVSQTGTVYVSDHNYVKKYDFDGNFVGCWGGLGRSVGQFNEVRSVAAHNGRIYAADRINNRVQVFEESGVVAGAWGRSGYAEGEFHSPCGIAVDEGEIVFVLDVGNSRVQLFGLDGTFLRAFSVPRSSNGIAVDNKEGIFITSRSLHVVRKYDYDGNNLLEWGGEGSGDGEFDSPIGVSIGPGGYVYVVDFENSRVQKFDSTGVFVAKWGVAGSDIGELYRPTGVACWGDFVFVADSNNHRVQRFHSSYWAADTEKLNE